MADVATISIISAMHTLKTPICKYTETGNCPCAYSANNLKMDMTQNSKASL